jgi:ParD-like antitoxin of type II bacterial toxin-antitoxin system
MGWAIVEPRVNPGPGACRKSVVEVARSGDICATPLRHQGPPMSDTPAFVSVKLPAGLVTQARETAQTMRRSVASQIEYWATLGMALELAGLSTTDSRALIARQERAAYGAPKPALPVSPELDDLQAHVLALSKSGALSARAQDAVAGGKAPAGRGKGRKSA